MSRRFARQPVPSSVSLVERGLPAGTSFPMIHAATPGGLLDAVEWAAAHRDSLQDDLDRHGAVLLRGFTLSAHERLQEIVQRLSGRDALDYDYRSTPRRRVSSKVYTSTEYPPEQEIPFHNEVAYAREWPQLLAFYCEVAAAQGGATPLADSCGVYRRLDESLRRRFERDGVRYVRNYGDLDLSWPEVFQTSDREEVDAYCAKAGIEVEWTGDSLTTRQVCQATTRHPRTGEIAWFNQAHLFHLSSLEPTVRDALLDVVPIEKLPRNAYYGDGETIPDEVIAEIQAAYEAEAVDTPWQPGDLLLVDNVLRAHGRRAFQGARRVLVAMA